jgi:hypothetical protein
MTFCVDDEFRHAGKPEIAHPQKIAPCFQYESAANLYEKFNRSFWPRILM